MFFTSEEAKLHILLEGDALASDCTSHSNNSSRTTAIIITSWSTDATEGTSAVVVGTEKDSLVGVLDCRVGAVGRISQAITPLDY